MQSALPLCVNSALPFGVSHFSFDTNSIHLLMLFLRTPISRDDFLLPSGGHKFFRRIVCWAIYLTVELLKKFSMIL